MKYSLVELAPVSPGGSKHDALVTALDAAREAEELGYHRIWYAEHHDTPGYASQDPVALIAVAARETTRIRVGSGAVLLNHYSPFSVAERFLQLEALAPGRIDLGLGRATAGPLVDAALRRDRQAQPVDDFASQVKEVLAHMHGTFAADHPFATFDLTAGIDSLPEVWLLGSSGNSADLAGNLALGYAFAGFINPDAAVRALGTHRDSFQAPPDGAGRRGAILALNMVAADDAETAHRLTWPARHLRQKLLTGEPATTSTVAEAEAALTPVMKALPSSFDGVTIPRQLAGTAATLRSQLEQLVQLTGATEIMVQDMLVDPERRTRSRELIAEAVAAIAP
ncbi:MsnO8 family LLM class oxidoreductase [Georgenia sp. MJ170]|uniref:MsnO8 family LLM class oxidoreductase n=1 Tax=Georgenia sunbinii TaxID=3117728 RepID=UPI002F26D23D